MRSKAFNNMSIFLYCIYWFYAKGKNLLDYSNLLSPNKYNKDDKIIPNYFQLLKGLGWKNILY